MFMDDTVMLSTSRENMYRKLRILQKYCNEYGMKINNEKKKQVCFVISDEGEDIEPFLEGGMTAEFVKATCT